MKRIMSVLPKQLKSWLGLPVKDASPERQRALDLIAAVDAGGLPLNPARVNDIARQLGLEVSTKAPVQDTIERIRAALAYPHL
jgi:hypothetical protein